MTTRTNHVFKGHKTLLGSRYVTYAEVELPIKYELFTKSKDEFDWGNNSSASIQLAFSILHQLSNTDFASQYATQFCQDIVKTLSSRDWILNAVDVLDWIEKNSDELTRESLKPKPMDMVRPQMKLKKTKTNVVKNVCRELSITQKNLAKILEVPEGTVSSWAVKNEIPRLGKKAIEFYILNKRNQDVVDSYKSFVKLLQNT
ncbi:MAG: DNA-binding transcriptional regulator YiaG [Sulfurimonas sp.]|jgi:DNA-binding transcriptional regulator YiaG